MFLYNLTQLIRIIPSFSIWYHLYSSAFCDSLFVLAPQASSSRFLNIPWLPPWMIQTPSPFFFMIILYRRWFRILYIMTTTILGRKWWKWCCSRRTNLDLWMAQFPNLLWVTPLIWLDIETITLLLLSSWILFPRRCRS